VKKQGAQEISAFEFGISDLEKIKAASIADQRATGHA
jgi:hypothetical protein